MTDPYIAKTTYCTELFEAVQAKKGVQLLKANYVLDGIKGHFYFKDRFYKVIVTVEPDVAEGSND